MRGCVTVVMGRKRDAAGALRGERREGAPERSRPPGMARTYAASHRLGTWRW